ncbi:MAG TPA: hypothetical protein VFU19_03470 [Iamia sp.]|nr:hypothetical protein [Iamia sp.]
MDPDDAGDDPHGTLLARLATGAEATGVVDSRFGTGVVGLGPGDLVVWLGDVVDPGREAVAAAVVRIDGSTAVVRAAGARTDALVARLGGEVAALASARGCTAVAADPDGPGVPGPTAVVARSGLVGAGPDRWTVEE